MVNDGKKMQKIGNDGKWRQMMVNDGNFSPDSESYRSSYFQ